ncbi:MAG TPA: hypothetical protein VFN74_06765 [Chloroflexota bacterium]|nr:hypothetical protein [Chloroflexota bacterium]
MSSSVLTERLADAGIDPFHGRLGSDYPYRMVLPGVPEIGYHVHLNPFNGSLVACLRYLELGAYVGRRGTYDYLEAITGAAFRRFWNRDDGGNVDLMYLAPEPYRRAFRALGLAFRVVPDTDRPAMVAAVKESIAQGKPVLAFGIVGPPECGLVTGYDAEGDVLIGRSYFSDETQPAAPHGGYYERDLWFERMGRGWGGGLIVLGEKATQPSEREILRETLDWAIQLARTPRRTQRPNHSCGLIAYEDWATALEVDADYPAEERHTMTTRTMVHADQVTMLCERRSAARYLRSLIDVASEQAFEQLFAAATLYDQVADFEQRLWPWGHSMGPEVGEALVRRDVRLALAREVLRAAAREVRAVEHLERARAVLRSGGLVGEV